MKTVYASFDTIFLGYLVGLLQSEGIEAEIRNIYAAGGFGELPPTDVTPEVCVAESQHARAQQIVDMALKSDSDVELVAWLCPQCRQEVEGQFSQCWQCGYVNEGAV